MCASSFGSFAGGDLENMDQNQAPVNKRTITTKDGKTLTVTVDRNLCIGAATCVAVAPKLFQLDNEAKAIVLETGSEETEQVILDSAKSCPVAAIIIEDDKGNKLFPN